MNELLDALTRIGNMPDVANNATQKQYLNVVTDALRTGNFQKAEELASNICSSYGMTRDQAYRQAKQFFGIK